MTFVNMKKELMFGFMFVLALFSLTNVLAAACEISVSMINQDPYPATPGEYVKVVFQINGIENPECGRVEFELLEKYPISLDPLTDSKVVIDAGTFKKDYSSFLLAPYKVRVDENALDGDTPIEVRYKFGANLGYESKEFDLNIEDTRAQFEIHVKDYDPSTKDLTLEILNIAETDIEALSVEIPKQENINVKGSNINIVGDLDSNEYTTADFKADLTDGEITIILHYSDKINERRTVTEKVVYDGEYFQVEQEKTSTKSIVITVLIILGIAYFVYRRWKKKKKLEELKKLKK